MLRDGLLKLLPRSEDRQNEMIVSWKLVEGMKGARRIVCWEGEAGAPGVSRQLPSQKKVEGAHTRQVGQTL